MMLQWPFILIMDGTVKEWKARIMNACSCLNERDERQCEVCILLYTNEAGIMCRLSEELAEDGV